MALYWHRFWKGAEKIDVNPNVQKLVGGKLKYDAYSKNEMNTILYHTGKGEVYIQSILAQCGIVNISVSNHEDLSQAMSICKKMGYSLVLYTTADYQKNTIKELEKLGFKKGESILNKRSNNIITVWTKDLYDFVGEF